MVDTMENPCDRISDEDFWAYENVRRSGVTNMFHVSNVCGLSGLDRSDVLYIMQNYMTLLTAYGEGDENE